MPNSSSNTGLPTSLAHREALPINCVANCLAASRLSRVAVEQGRARDRTLTREEEREDRPDWLMLTLPLDKHLATEWTNERGQQAAEDLLFFPPQRAEQTSLRGVKRDRETESELQNLTRGVCSAYPRTRSYLFALPTSGNLLVKKPQIASTFVPTWFVAPLRLCSLDGVVSDQALSTMPCWVGCKHSAVPARALSRLLVESIVTAQQCPTEAEQNTEEKLYTAGGFAMVRMLLLCLAILDEGLGN